eukprot:scaffold104606_cov14-Tisochrysis_lutea.AAC.2
MAWLEREIVCVRLFPLVDHDLDHICIALHANKPQSGGAGMAILLELLSFDQSDHHYFPLAAVFLL